MRAACAPRTPGAGVAEVGRSAKASGSHESAGAVSELSRYRECLSTTMSELYVSSGVWFKDTNERSRSVTARLRVGAFSHFTNTSICMRGGLLLIWLTRLFCESPVIPWSRCPLTSPMLGP